MTSTTPATVYSYHTEDFAMCLVFFGNASSVPALLDIIGICDDLVLANELNYIGNLLPTRVELHFESLNTFALMLLTATLTSKKHEEWGDWAFVPSDVGQELN